jgi:hypothetical protein
LPLASVGLPVNCLSCGAKAIFFAPAPTNGRGLTDTCEIDIGAYFERWQLIDRWQHKVIYRREFVGSIPAAPAIEPFVIEIAYKIGLAGELLHSSATHCCVTGCRPKMAFHIFRRQAVYYWRRRAPRALANRLGRPHVSMSLRTTSRMTARRLATRLNLILDDIAMLADGADPHLSRSQIETMLHAVVERHLAKLERVAFAAKSAPGFDVDQARADDVRAVWTYTLLDAQGYSAAVRPEDRSRMVSFKTTRMISQDCSCSNWRTCWTSGTFRDR